MKKLYYYLMLLPVLLFSMAVFLAPAPAYAGSFANVHLTVMWSSLTAPTDVPLANVNVNITSKKDNDSKWSSGGACFGCRTCAIRGGVKLPGFDCNGTDFGSEIDRKTTGTLWGSDSSNFIMDNSFSCGASTCDSSTDLGGCNPFIVTLSASNNNYASWYHGYRATDGSWHVVKVGETGSNVYTFEINVKNGSTVHDYYIYQEQAAPNLRPTLNLKNKTDGTTMSNNVLTADPGDTVEVWQKVYNGGSATEAYIRDNIAVNGNNSYSSGRSGSSQAQALAISEAASSYNVSNTTNAAGLLGAQGWYESEFVMQQASGQYGDAYQREWRFGTMNDTVGGSVPNILPQYGDYWVKFEFKIKADESLRGKWIGNMFGTDVTRDWTSYHLSNQAFVHIRPNVGMVCHVNPTSGDNPLAVEVTVDSTLTTGFTYDFHDGIVLTDRGRSAMHTYASDGVKTITVTNPDATTPCPPLNVTVKKPSDSSGGEVSP
jgi:hypothetical protein